MKRMTLSEVSSLNAFHPEVLNKETGQNIEQTTKTGNMERAINRS